MAETLPLDTQVDVLGLGALNMDYWYNVPRIEADTEQVVIGEGSGPGGSSANTICALGKLSLRVAFLGAVGNDDNSVRILRDFQEAGVAIEGISRKVGKAGHTICLVDEHARRSIFVSPGVNSQLSDADIDPSWFSNARALLLSSFADDAQLDLQVGLVQALPDTVMLGFAPGTLYANRGLSALRPILARTDIVFLNGEELAQLGGRDFEASVQTLHRVGCRRVVVTLGGHQGGKLWFASDGESVTWGSQRLLTHLPIKDSTGAGDAFAAGFLWGMLSNQTQHICGAMGQVVAEFCLSQDGPRSGLPSLEAFQRAIAGVA